MKNLSFYIFIAYCALLLLVATALSHADVPAKNWNGNLGFSGNQVVDDISAGLTGELEYQRPDLFKIDVEGQLNAGDIYRAKLTLTGTFDLGPVGVKLTSANIGKGYELATMGRNQTLTAALNVPLTPLIRGAGGLAIDIGLGGKSAAPWGAPNLLNDAIPLGYDEGVLESIGAGDITPAPRGLPPREVTAAVLFAATSFEKDWLEGDVRLISEITGEDKGHQVIVHLQTQSDAGWVVVGLAYEYGGLFWKGDFHSEHATTLTGTFPF